VGAHPSVVFKTISASTSTGQTNVIVARRYFAGELAPSYTVTQHLDLGVYYFYAKGIDTESIQTVPTACTSPPRWH
jgi:hypothetical protein